jgi:O-antigen/teichoic acid export membrane protein
MNLKKIVKKYNGMGIAVKAGIWFTICNFLQKAISMITMPIFTRLLPTEDYGLFTIYQSWYSIVSIFVTLNLAGAVVNNGMIKYKNKRAEFISSLQGLSTTVTVSFFIVYFLNRSFWEKMFELPTSLMLVMFVQLLFEPAYLFWMQRNRFEFKYHNVVSVTLILAIVSPILGIIAVVTAKDKVFARVFSYAIVQICVGLIFYILQAYKGKKFFDKGYWKFALAFNLPLIPHYLSQNVLGQADRIMIGNMVGNSKAAIYSVAYTVASIMTLMINAINSSFIPSLYQNLDKKKYDKIEKGSFPLCIIIAIAVCGVMLIGPEVIRILASKEYAEAIYCIPPVAASIFFTYLYTLFINVEFYFEKTTYSMIVSVLGAILNVFLNYILIPKFGYIAAGYTTLVCYILFAVGHGCLCVSLKKMANIAQPLFSIHKIIVLSIVLLTYTVVINILYSYPTIRILTIIIAIVGAIFNYKKIMEITMKIIKK